MSEFEKMIEDATSRIPERFKVILEKENIKLLAREKAPEVLQDKFQSKLIFGIFIGVSYTNRSVFNIQQEPTRVELYKESFEKVFNNKEDIKTQIIKTVVHEIGHYFGFSELKIRNIGY